MPISGLVQGQRGIVKYTDPDFVLKLALFSCEICNWFSVAVEVGGGKKPLKLLPPIILISSWGFKNPEHHNYSLCFTSLNEANRVKPHLGARPV